MRVEHPEQLPPPQDDTVDVAVLDMNHGWPNLGHDSLVHTVLDASCDLLGALRSTGLHLRVLSFDVRRGGVVPEPPGGRFGLYLGTGGPGHLDPALNRDGLPGSQDLDEDPAWEAPVFALFDAILADREAALLAVCHTFGVLCRWAGLAAPVLRGPAKQGKSTGIRENELTEQARAHPWFGRFAEVLPDRARLRIMDNRLFDMLPVDDLDVHARTRPSPTVIGFEVLPDGQRGDALTMVEFARDPGGVMPRLFGVNHHPEIVNRERQQLVLDQKRRHGGEALPTSWYEERYEALTRTFAGEDTNERLHLTSDYTLLGPLRFHVLRLVRQRALARGLRVHVHEDQLLAEHGLAAAGVRA